MYAGQLVEGGPSEEVIQRPKHPYTQLLLSAAPDPDRFGSTDRQGDRVETPGTQALLAADGSGEHCHAERLSRNPEPFAHSLRSGQASLKGKLREGEASLLDGSGKHCHAERSEASLLRVNSAKDLSVLQARPSAEFTLERSLS